MIPYPIGRNEFCSLDSSSATTASTQIRMARAKTNFILFSNQFDDFFCVEMVMKLWVEETLPDLFISCFLKKLVSPHLKLLIFITIDGILESFLITIFFLKTSFLIDLIIFLDQLSESHAKLTNPEILTFHKNPKISS